MVDNPTVKPAVRTEELRAAFGPGLRFDYPLAPLTSYKTGGPARYFISAGSADDIVHAVAAARRLGIPYFLIGGGSNLLVSDNGFDGLIIKVDVRGIHLIGRDEIDCGAGEELMALVKFAADHALTGLEFAAGIWGSVGGALYGNAGAFGGEIGSIVKTLTLVDVAGKVKDVGPEYCRFAYRDSFLKKTREVVARARFSLQSGDQAAIRARVNEILQLRDGKHPNTGMSAGCFFKNIPDPSQPFGKLPAGKLLEEAGAKQLHVGKAKVFEKHANIIVNTGGATSREIRELADMMKQRVRDRFHIELEEEVIQVGSI